MTYSSDSRCIINTVMIVVTITDIGLTESSYICMSGQLLFEVNTIVLFGIDMILINSNCYNPMCASSMIM